MRSIRPLFAAAALASLFAARIDAATVTLVVQDAAGVGFNDLTPVSALPGNPATTLGQQRLNAFQAAANVWGAKLQSNVVIQVGVQMQALTCSSTSGILGQAGPLSVNRDFVGAPRAGTYYAIALANSLFGSDADSVNPDINATFNSTLDLGGAGCLNGLKWWYGIGSPPQGNTIDFLSTVLHEIAHGLGFTTFVNSVNGQKFNGFDDAYMVNLEDHSLGLTWPSLTNSQRISSSIDNGDLHWVGSNVTSRSLGLFTAGVNAQGHVRMYAPTVLLAGSSVSHWDTVLTPNELMEPSATSDAADLATTFALQDTGWTLQSGASCTFSLSPTSTSVAAAGASGTVLVTTTAGCAWTASSNSAFITVTGGASGTGSGSVSYSVSANTGAARSGTLTIGGQTFTMNQSGATTCNFALNPTSASPAASGGAGIVIVTTTVGCAWTASSSSSFLTITGGASGSGTGTVSYSVSTNTGAARSGTLTIAGQTFTVNQAAASGGGSCVANSTTLCISSRFKIQVSWFTSQGGGLSGTATAVAAAPLGFTAGGIFWFFDASNPEMLVKVLNGCSTNNRYWVFETAGTNVGFTMTVTDTATGISKQYVNADLTLSQAIQDTGAFATCP